jgi:hypothetical protein
MVLYRLYGKTSRFLMRNAQFLDSTSFVSKVFLRLHMMAQVDENLNLSFHQL